VNLSELAGRAAARVVSGTPGARMAHRRSPPAPPMLPGYRLAAVTITTPPPGGSLRRWRQRGGGGGGGCQRPGSRVCRAGFRVLLMLRRGSMTVEVRRPIR
jgi:hypothetical protein